MGIRFRCPNGHKLHVKVFLAGKRGICPKCGAKFQIPQESDPELAKNAKILDSDRPSQSKPAAKSPGFHELASPVDIRPEKLPGALIDITPQVDEVPVIHPRPIARPAITANANATAPNNRSQNQPSVDGAETPVRHAEAEAVPQVAVDVSQASDPISEAPHAVWYVRPPSGGQFGPASGDVMRSWISQGRVTFDSLVWREGWPEWKQAGGIFPGLLVPGSGAAASEIPQIVTNLAGGTSSELYRRRKSTRTTLSVVVLLILACIILFGALVYVVRFMN